MFCALAANDEMEVVDKIMGKWFFSIVDVCWILAESKDYKTARKYWNKLKERLVEEGNKSVTNCHQLKLVFPAGCSKKGWA